jgi:hypothetical protein
MMMVQLLLGLLIVKRYGLHLDDTWAESALVTGMDPLTVTISMKISDSFLFLEIKLTFSGRNGWG